MPRNDAAIRAGALRHQLLLQSPVIATDELNNPVVIGWDLVAAVWGEITDLDGSEVWHAQLVQAGTTHLVTLRYRDGVNSQQRLVYQGRVFNVTNVSDVGQRRRKLVLQCKEQEGVLYSTILLEDGTDLLLEDGTAFLTE